MPIGGRIDLLTPPVPAQREGKWLAFKRCDDVFKRPAWDVRSQRGGFLMGTIEWSPSWDAYGLVPLTNGEIVRWNGGSIAEVYAFLKERGTATGRFV